MSLSTIVKLSNLYGANPDFVLAGGGNTSYKTKSHLYVKGSGTTLATITEEGFVKMNRSKLAAMLIREYSGDPAEREAQVLADMMAAREATEYSKRPSVETLLHNMIPYTYVVHTHPAMLNGLTCGRDGEKIASELFGDTAVWVGLVEPGYTLAMELKRVLADYRAQYGKEADVILLQNHGLFLAGNSEKEVKKKTKRVFDLIRQKITRLPDFSKVPMDKERAALLAPAVRMLLKGDSSTASVSFVTNREVLACLKDQASFSVLESAFSPDHIVYCRPWPLYVESREDLEEQYKVLETGVQEYQAKHGFLPKIVCVQNLGYFAWGSNKKNSSICADVFLDAVKIGVYTGSFGGPLFLTDHMIRFICNWEVESYRKKVSLAGRGAKRLEGKISIVTGSAQGFGQGIADEMLKQDAYVVIADLNDALAKENSRAMNVAYGQNATIALKVDVGDEESVKNMVYDTVLEYGGLDVFVSNAGVAIAGALEEMTVAKFEFVTKINYTAFYLCAKYASRIMKIQNRFDPSYFMDIIQINSKSGLEGSNKNFAYAGSKFGGLGLTQSFALELVPYHIKVNAICPGNLLNGPLWSDPVKGLFVQYFRAGKVPGAKSVEDVRKYYESKVPMKRGCEILDVARAIFYIIEQEYETGQAIPVTGGQVMLK